MGWPVANISILKWTDVLSSSCFLLSSSTPNISDWAYLEGRAPAQKNEEFLMQCSKYAETCNIPADCARHSSVLTSQVRSTVFCPNSCGLIRTYLGHQNRMMVHASGFPAPFAFIIRLRSKGCIRKHQCQLRSLFMPIIEIFCHGKSILIDGLTWYIGLIFGH